MNTVSTRLMGGLGNMMFQISAAFAVSLRDEKDFICNTENMMTPHKSYDYYSNNIFRKIKFSSKFENFEVINEQGFNYHKIPSTVGNAKLNGYFQSEKYFIDFKKEILNLFEIDQDTESYLSEKYQKILNNNTCSIHVRRGDYINLPNHHPTQSMDYYKNAIKMIGMEKSYLIFSDDIEWCKLNFDFLENKIFVNGNTDFQDLYLMSKCNDNIIANSTFSWWGAWLNQNPNKKVIAPKIWFGNFYSNFNTNDLYFQDSIIL